MDFISISPSASRRPFHRKPVLLPDRCHSRHADRRSPGIGATATIAMLLPITFQLEPVSSLIMLAGIYYGRSMAVRPRRS